MRLSLNYKALQRLQRDRGREKYRFFNSKLTFAELKKKKKDKRVFKRKMSYYSPLRSSLSLTLLINSGDEDRLRGKTHSTLLFIRPSLWLN